MTAGVVIAVLGMVAMCTGGRITSNRIRQHHGSDIFRSKAATHATAGTGVVPRWVSSLTLAGWAGLIVGVIVVIASAFG
ncbi:MAG: hypothetical protein OXB99_06355 [Acidimicrobiaceae bacterium]|nr:hypothetical protein [Acidimicrobiaceae bacterium]